MARPQMIGHVARTIDLTAQRDDARIVSHRLVCVPFGTIRHWRSDDKVIELAPFGERNLKRAEERAEKRHAGSTR